MQTVTRSISRYLGLPEDSGVIIVNVAQNSAADKAVKLKPGDFVIKVNNEKIDKPSDIRRIILENDLRSGDKINMKIYRDGRLKHTKMKLGKFVE